MSSFWESLKVCGKREQRYSDEQTGCLGLYLQHGLHPDHHQLPHQRLLGGDWDKWGQFQLMKESLSSLFSFQYFCIYSVFFAYFLNIFKRILSFSIVIYRCFNLKSTNYTIVVPLSFNFRYILVYHNTWVLAGYNRKILDFAVSSGSVGYCLILTIVSLVYKENYILYMGMTKIP